MTRRALDVTTNLVSLYLHHCGESEVPEDYHLFSCLSMIAALVGDNVWYEKFRGEKLCPNLYVSLIGPSALGKGEAIATALKFVKDNPRVNLYAGTVTAQALVRRMGVVRDSNGTRVSRGKIFLVTPEVSMSLGRGERADSFIQHMTELYTGRDYPLRADTISRGEVKLTEYCVNWLLGTTLKWLVDSVPQDMMTGGFIGRITPVMADYDFTKRMMNPRYPADYDEVLDYLSQQFEELSHVEGPFQVAPEAEANRQHWYATREAPSNELLIPAWKREDDLVLKLSMILSLAESLDLTIKAHHVAAAQRLSARALKEVPMIVAASSKSPETAGLDDMRTVIKRLGMIQHAVLVRWASARGMNAERVRHHIDNLIQERRVERMTTQRGIVYVWRERFTGPAGSPPRGRA